MITPANEDGEAAGGNGPGPFAFWPVGMRRAARRRWESIVRTHIKNAPPAAIRSSFDTFAHYLTSGRPVAVVQVAGDASTGGMSFLKAVVLDGGKVPPGEEAK